MSSCALAFKLYWRRLAGSESYHCFEADKARPHGAPGRYVSLCKHVRIDRLHGVDVNRPNSHLRCAICDGREIARHQRDEGLDDHITHPERPLH